MITDKDELFELYGNLTSMVFPDFQKFVFDILNSEKLSKNELADLLETDVKEIEEILQGDFSNVTLGTYLLVLIARGLTLDVHSIEAPYDHSRDKSKYDKVEKKTNEKKDDALQVDENLPKKELADFLGISVLDVDKFLYDHSSGKSIYDKLEKDLKDKTNEFLDALKECKPDSNYLQQLRELAKTNAGNEKLCNLIKYYTD